LLVGIDTTPERAGAGSLPLADAIILAQLDPVGKRAVMLSIPRDLAGRDPGYRMGSHQCRLCSR
jgi:anionic cell wall polymer biosynthesis LytR-Cps2A-Psr (LCP) family protein